MKLVGAEIEQTCTGRAGNDPREVTLHRCGQGAARDPESAPGKSEAQLRFRV